MVKSGNAISGSIMMTNSFSQLINLPVLEQVIDYSPIAVSPDTSLVDVILLMSQASGRHCSLPHIKSSIHTDLQERISSSCVLVIDGSRLVGIFTERDVVKLAASEMRVSELKIANAMTQPVITMTLSDSATTMSALELFRQYRIRHLPVLDDRGELVGVVTPNHIRQVLRSTNLLRLRKVAEVINPQVIHASRTTSVLKIAQQMSEHCVSCVVIAENGHERSQGSEDGQYLTPVGIITERDIVQFQVLDLNLDQIQAETVMSTPLFCLHPSNTLWVAHQEMQSRHVRRLVVAGDRGELKGIVTQTSLLQVLDPIEMIGIAETLQQELEQRTADLDRINQRLQQEIQEHLQTEALLENSQRQLQSIFDHVFQFIGLLSPEGKLLAANQASLDFVGVCEADVIGRPFWDTPWWTHSTEGQGILKKAIKQAAGGEFVRREVTHLSATGHLETFDFSLTPVKNEFGKAIFLIPEGREISDRKQVELRLLSDQNQLEREVEQRTVELARTNAQLQLEITQRYQAEKARAQQIERERLITSIAQQIRQSLSLEDILRTTVEEVRQFLKVDRALIYRFSTDGVGTIIAEAVLPHYPPLLGQSFPEEVFPQAFHQAYAEGKIRAISNVEHAEMEPCMLEFVKQFGVQAKLVIPILQGETLWGLLIVHQCHQTQQWKSLDIELLKQLSTQVEIAIQQAQLYQQVQIELSDRKLAEQKISEQAMLLDIATDAIIVRDLENRILFWNQGAEKIYGWQTEEALTQNASELLYKETPSSPIEQIVLERGMWQGELQQVTKDGRDIIVDSRWTLVCNEAGQPKSFLVVNTDITEKKQLEQQFLHAQRLESLGTLASGIAHDLNNILTPILATAQLLPLTLPLLNQQNQNLLNLLIDSASRGSNLVKQILFFAKGTEGNRITLQVAHLLREIRQLIVQTFPKSIEVQIHIPEGLWMITGDATQLHQVLMNLCVNARDAMPNGGVLSLSPENLWFDEQYVQMELDAKVGPYLVITIADTGTGIEPDILDRIFDPFFTTKETSKGTGLGLSTVIGIVKSYGGFVKVNSKIGEGTQFKLFFPATETTDIIPQEDLQPPAGNGESILVVDDETPILAISKETLKIYNYRVLTANNGIEAIAQYAQYQDKISAVVMDMMMPEMGGEMAIQTLRLMNPQVKIIAFSGIVSNQGLAEAAGAKAFLAKPFTANDLLNTLHRVLAAE
jgi:two-component system, cell cycle sensor histidine kinase and response regulator CckA